MAWCAPDWPRVHQAESMGLWSLPLAVCSVPYGMGSRIRSWLYNRGIFKKKYLPGFVVSVGNLTVGGTGKTPAVAMVAKWAQGEGYRVAVLSRGYRSRSNDKVLEVSDGHRIEADPEESGDEAYLLAKKLSGIPLMISRKRYFAGLFAHERFGCDFFILDDGFQHLELERDLDVVLMDAEKPFGNRHLLPWGPLREPVAELARADVFILTRAGSYRRRAPDLLTRDFSDTPVFFAEHLPSDIVFPDSNRVRTPDFINGKSVVAFAGIGRPEKFRDTLEKLGARVVNFKRFRDHHPFDRGEIEALIRLKEKIGARYLITTEKDWIRLRSVKRTIPELAYLRIEFVLLSDHDRFFQLVGDAVQKSGNTARNTGSGQS